MLKSILVTKYTLRIYKNNLISTIKQFKNHIMGNLLYTFAIILMIIWAIGFFAYSAGMIIHILFVIAVISILARIISGNKIAK